MYVDGQKLKKIAREINFEIIKLQILSRAENFTSFFAQLIVAATTATKLSRNFHILHYCENFYPKISHRFCNFCFIYFSEKMRNFAKKLTKCEQKCSHFFAKLSFAANPRTSILVSRIFGIIK